MDWNISEVSPENIIIYGTCKGMQVPYGQHPVMVQLHMGYISAFSHHQSMSDPVRIHSGAESGHNLFCLRFPTVRPIQMGKGILHQWLLYCRSSVLLCHDPLMDCKECHERFRADKLIEDFCAEHDIESKEA